MAALNHGHRWPRGIAQLVRGGLLTVSLTIATPGLAVDFTKPLQLAFLRAAPAQAAPDTPPAEPPAPLDNIPIPRRAIEAAPLLDPANPDHDRLQTIGEATRGMPYDANRFPDWMKALNQGLIKPRSSLDGKGSMEVLELDIIMRNTKEMPFVRFPHKSHTLWLACSNCHPAPFKAQAGSTAIRMADIFRGQFCGMCHDRVAFITFYSCQRCHSVPQPSATPGKAGEHRP